MLKFVLIFFFFHSSQSVAFIILLTDWTTAAPATTFPSTMGHLIIMDIWGRCATTV